MDALVSSLRAAPAYELAPCPACGAAAASELSDAGQIRRELELLWQFHTRRLRPDAPPGALTDRLAFTQEPPFRLVRCVCGTVYRNPRERSDDVAGRYEAEEPDPAALDALFEAQLRFYRRRARALTRLFGRRGTGIEVGSYVGGFLAAAGEEGWHFRGVDVNPGTNAFARARGLHVEESTLEEADAEPVDVVAIWNCLDQLPDPATTVRAARARLVPGGVLALRVPNGAFYAGLRPLLDGRGAGAAAAVLALNNLLGFPYRTGFTPASLRALLEGAGFEVVRTRGDALVPLRDRWTHAWAGVEERLIKGITRALARAGASAPWFELWARQPARPNG